MALPIYRYPLDPTGKDRNNLVAREPHQLTPKTRITDVRVMIPLYGPFYADTVEIVDMVNNRVLIPKVDYVATDLLQDPSLKFAAKISQIIVIKNATVSNNVEVKYQVLGGNYQNDSTALKHVWESYLNDARAVDWDDIENKPATFPPSEHIHLLSDVVGWGPMVVALERLRNAIMLSNSSILENFIEWFKYRPVDWNLVINRPTTLEGYGIIDAVHISRRIRTIGGIEGGGDLSKDLTIQLTKTGVVAGDYGGKSKYTSFSVDDRGRLARATTFDLIFADILQTPTTLAGYGITDAVNLWGQQTIDGQKTFTKQIIQSPPTGQEYMDSYRTASTKWGSFWRMENDSFWLLLTNAGAPLAANNGFRPMRVDMLTGDVHFGHKVFAPGGVIGNATSADKLAKPVKISMIGGATSTPINFDGSADFIMTVTGLDVSKVNAGVLSGLYGGTGMDNFVIGNYFVAESATKMKQINAKDMMTDLGKNVKLIAGDGLVGGGDLSADRTISMGTPGTLSGTTPNAVAAGTHTHNLAAATTTLAGVARRATDTEVINFTGDGTITPPQLKNVMSKGTSTPKPVINVGSPGTATKYSAEDHVHAANRGFTSGYAGVEFVNSSKILTKADIGKFYVMARPGQTLTLPSPSLFDAATDLGLTIEAWVAGYDGSGFISFNGSNGVETYRFYSKIICTLSNHAGPLAWVMTDDGHTIFSNSEFGDPTYSNRSWTRLGNPAESTRITGVLYMETFRMHNIWPGQNATGYFRRAYLNGAVRAFASLRSNNVRAAPRVLELNNSNIVVTVDAIGDSSGAASLDILVFGSYRYDQE